MSEIKNEKFKIKNAKRVHGRYEARSEFFISNF
jgi:hypothetical protein